MIAPAHARLGLVFKLELVLGGPHCVIFVIAREPGIDGGVPT